MALYAEKYGVEKRKYNINKSFRIPARRYNREVEHFFLLKRSSKTFMPRAHYYQKQIVNKLLSSKFVYHRIPKPQLIKKLIVHSNVKVKNPEVGSAYINIIFGRRPTFNKIAQRYEKEYRLIHLALTSNKHHVVSDLDYLANALLPFQLENRLHFSKERTGHEISWTWENCTPGTPLNPVVFPYPVSDDSFNLTILLFPQKNVSAATSTFYLNLFQLPITIT